MKAKIILTMAMLNISTAAMSAPIVAAATTAPDNAALTTAMNHYLSERGDLCVGKFDWPIDVSAADVQAHTRDAIQMPVLEHLGLVTATPGTALRKQGEEGAAVAVAVKRYALTEAGKKFYLKKTIASAVANGKVHQGDFCAGKLSLDKIVGWDGPAAHGDDQEMTVTYTYKVAPAEWARNAEAQKVFPMVDRIIKGEGSLQLQQRFRLASNGWVAVGLSE